MLSSAEAADQNTADHASYVMFVFLQQHDWNWLETCDIIFVDLNLKSTSESKVKYYIV